MRKRTIKPNGLFTVWTADQVAECLDGVPMELYRKLWNEIVPLQDGPNPNIEDMGPEVGDDTLSAFWDKLTNEEQATLNRAATAFRKKIGEDSYV